MKDTKTSSVKWERGAGRRGLGSPCTPVTTPPPSSCPEQEQVLAQWSIPAVLTYTQHINLNSPGNQLSQLSPDWGAQGCRIVANQDSFKKSRTTGPNVLRSSIRTLDSKSSYRNVSFTTKFRENINLILMWDLERCGFKDLDPNTDLPALEGEALSFSTRSATVPLSGAWCHHI